MGYLRDDRKAVRKFVFGRTKMKTRKKRRVRVKVKRVKAKKGKGRQIDLDKEYFDMSPDERKQMDRVMADRYVSETYRY